MFHGFHIDSTGSCGKRGDNQTVGGQWAGPSTEGGVPAVTPCYPTAGNCTGLQGIASLGIEFQDPVWVVASKQLVLNLDSGVYVVVSEFNHFLYLVKNIQSLLY